MLTLRTLPLLLGCTAFTAAMAAPTQSNRHAPAAVSAPAPSLDVAVEVAAGEAADAIVLRARRSSLPAPVEIEQLDRWDYTIAEVSEFDTKRAALLKSFVAVESMGRQYAISPTGCAGLMQFCVSTARETMFDDVFRDNHVRRCRCRGRRCRLGTKSQQALESGDAQRVRRAARRLPCSVHDDRFDPERSLRAGLRYVEWLSDRYDGSIELTYVAYNSGPAIADKLHRHLVAEGADLDPYNVARAIDEILEGHRRARILIEQQLPRVREHYLRYRHTQPVTNIGPKLSAAR